MCLQASSAPADYPGAAQGDRGPQWHFQDVIGFTLMLSQPQLCFIDCPVPPLAVSRVSGVGSGAQAEPAAVRRMACWDWAAPDPLKAGHAVVCVHGLSRQGRDFDVLARALQPHVRVVCPDVAGRGQSDWLADPMAYQIPTYVADMVALLAQLRAQGVQTIDWVGTSMGGLIGMVLAAQPALGIRRLVLNDVGPAIEASALLRIGSYLGQGQHFASLEEGADYLWSILAAFGPHTQEEWLALSAPMFKPVNGRWHLHYDPALAVPFRALTGASAQEAAVQGEALMWQVYEHITAPTLLLRGAQSDLLSAATAHAMTQRGPRARLVTVDGVGHAPTLVHAGQVHEVTSFVLDQ